MHPPLLLHPLAPCLRLVTCLATLIGPVLGALPGLDGPDPVGPYFNDIFPISAPGDPSGWAVENAFPALTFNDPMMLAEIPGSSDLLVVGKTGLIWRFPNDPAATMAQRVQALDWTTRTQVAEDQGFYSLSFHPNFGQSGQPGEDQVFVCYSRAAFEGVDDPESRSYWTVSRFNWLPASGTIDPASEYILMSQYDPHQFHNGGATFFDNSGYLCVTVGDGGDGADRFNNSQRINLGFFGGVLRIDVDYYEGKPGSHAIRRQPTEDPNWHLNPKPPEWPVSYSQGYGIPDDNPWQDPAGGWLEEFYAIGLRSPHSAHYDPATGEIWIGDVGQNTWEELTRVVKGSNCQWAYKEGNNSTSKNDPDTLIDIETPPVHEYDHSVGASIIGGMRYRGAKWNSFLGGKVIFGDHVRGRVWSLELDPGGGAPTVSEMFSSFHTGYKAGLANFSTDSAGEIYLMDLGGSGNPTGRIMKLAVPAISAEPPQFLSETGVFTNLATLTTAPGVIPYDVPNPLWSDGADKKRWIILPNDGAFDSAAEKIGFDEEQPWLFPPGTVLVKHFEVPVDAGDPSSVKRLETRFIVCTVEGGKYGFSYKWNAAGTDAELMESGLNESYDYDTGSGIEARTWSYPSRGDCMICHNDTAGQALGVRTFHLNSETFYPSTGRTANQLETLNSLGVFDVDLSASQLADFIEARAPDDTTAPLEHRVRSYLDTNCSHCHQPGAQGGGFDARLGTPLDLQNIINGIPDRYEELGPDGRYIKPGDTSLSAINVRLGAVGNGDAMPPLAKNLAHGQGIADLQSYINGLTPAEFASTPAPQARYVRLTSLTGKRRYAAVGEFTILDGEGEAIPFASITATADLEAGSNTLAGEANDGNPGSGSNFWQTPSTPSSSTAPNHPHWLKLDLGSVRDIGGFIYYPRPTSSDGRIYQYIVEYSEDGSTWVVFDSGTWADTPEPYKFDPLYNKRPARCEIAGPTAPPLGDFDVTVVFDMDTNEFDASDFTVTGGTVSSLRGSGYYYVASITPAAEDVGIQVNADAIDPERMGSLASAALQVTAIPDVSPPSMPGNLVAVPAVASVELSWDASDDDAGVVGYEIRRNGILVTTVAGLGFVDTGLDPDTLYAYTVIAVDSPGNPSPEAATSTVTLEDVTAPSPPGDFTATPGFESIQLDWTESTDDVGVTSYAIRRDTVLIATVATPGYLDTGLPRDTGFTYEIVAIDAAANTSIPAGTTTATKGFDEWLEDFGLSGQTATDSDSGGLDNLSEYYLEMDPTSPADDSDFKLAFTIQGPVATITLPDLKPTGDFHLHASDSLVDLADPSKRLLSITKAQINSMTPAEREGYTLEAPADGNRGFFMLFFEPVTP